MLAPMVMGWMPVVATPPERRDEGWAVRGGLVGAVEVEVGGLGRDIVIGDILGGDCESRRI